MNQEIKYVSVTALNRYIHYKFENDDALKEVYLQGEISNCKFSKRHLYLSLKDENSEISAMFFYPANLNLKFVPKDGMKVQVCGRISVYEKRGTYSIIITNMIECGIGILYQQFMDLKAKLEAEGLFDESHKLPIPEYPRVVGVITASTGEAINDIISTFNKRLPLATIKLFPAIVQGQECPRDLVRALNLAYKDPTIEALIIGRGGGSFEDLNGFNDEALARKLYQAPFPTVSAVGHEGDYTICDFVCSFRAPTPTGAAMKLTKDKADVLQLLQNLTARLVSSMKNTLINDFNQYEALRTSRALLHFDELIEQKESKLEDITHKLRLLSPTNIAKQYDDTISDLTLRLDSSINQIFTNNSLLLDNLSSRVNKEVILDKIASLDEKVIQYQNNLSLSINNKLTMYENILASLLDKNVILNPFNIMKKGYSIVYKDDTILDSVNSINEDDSLKIRFNDGEVYTTVNKIERNK